MGLEEELRSMLEEGDTLDPPDLREPVISRIRRERHVGSIGWIAAAAVVICIVAVATGAILRARDSSSAAEVVGSGGPSILDSDAPSTVVGSPPPALATPSATPRSPAPMLAGYPLPTTSPDAAGMDALAIGTLNGEIRQDRVCFWVSGEGGRRSALVWPYGFRAQLDPLRLLGGDGQTVAEAGDRVELGGGTFPDRAPTPEEDPCTVGRLFFVSSVSSVNGKEIRVGGGSIALDRRPPGTSAACADAYQMDLMLVMANGELKLLLPTGTTLRARWPSTLSARWGNRIVIVDPSGKTVMTQGVSDPQVIAHVTSDVVDVCGFGKSVHR